MTNSRKSVDEMKTKSISLTVSPTVGAVSGEYVIPEKCEAVLTLAHGAGAGMNHPFMVKLANSLAEQGMATLRFNFPFMENKKGRPDTPAVAHKTIEVAIDHVLSTFPSLPLFVSGKSFGGRMSSQFLSTHQLHEVKGIIFFGFPLHPSGKPSTERADHLKNVMQPMLFLQGTKDELATWNLVESVCHTLPQATLVRIEGADHAFKIGKQDVMPLLTSPAISWMEKVLKKLKQAQ